MLCGTLAQPLDEMLLRNARSCNDDLQGLFVQEAIETLSDAVVVLLDDGLSHRLESKLGEASLIVGTLRLMFFAELLLCQCALNEVDLSLLAV